MLRPSRRLRGMRFLILARADVARTSLALSKATAVAPRCNAGPTIERPLTCRFTRYRDSVLVETRHNPSPPDRTNARRGCQCRAWEIGPTNGPRTRIMMAGRKQKARGKRIFTGTLAARSRARCRRLSRISSA